jgi:Flp pilus assembly protein TadD
MFILDGLEMCFLNKRGAQMKNISLLILTIIISSGLFCSLRAQEEHSALYYNMEGVRFAKDKDYDRAIDSFMRAIQIDPQYVRGYVNLAIIYKRNEDYESALSYLEKAFEIDPTLVDIYTNLSDIYRLQGNFEKAKIYADKAIELTKDTPETIYNLGYAYLLNGERELALAQHKKLIEMGAEELAGRLMEKIKTRQKRSRRLP